MDALNANQGLQPTYPHATIVQTRLRNGYLLTCRDQDHSLPPPRPGRYVFFIHPKRNRKRKRLGERPDVATNSGPHTCVAFILSWIHKCTDCSARRGVDPGLVRRSANLSARYEKVSAVQFLPTRYIHEPTRACMHSYFLAVPIFSRAQGSKNKNKNGRKKPVVNEGCLPYPIRHPQQKFVHSKTPFLHGNPGTE